MQRTIHMNKQGDLMAICLNRRARTFDMAFSPADGDSVGFYGVMIRGLEDLQLAIEDLLEEAYQIKEDGQ
jgi:hypothetical protein